MIDYDVGLGTKYFYCFIKNRKRPIAKISSEELNTVQDVEDWAKKEVNNWLKR